MNSWFQFKQFIIHQENTAMKVCTDACLFGAWVAKKLEQKEIQAENILDIGSGTGLLSLMLAQKSSSKIHGVEIDKNAYEQSCKNLGLTDWSRRIKLHNTSIINFESNIKYDLIISNPPFYEDQLKSTNAKRNEAMHATSLSFLQLISCIKKNLTANGMAAILLPSTSENKFERILVENNLFVIEKMQVAHSPLHPYFRCMLLIAQTKKDQKQNTLFIKLSDKLYSPEFKHLLKDYYLDF